MTESTPSARRGPGTGSFDSTAQLMNRITAQLNTQLTGLPTASRPPARPPVLVAVAHGSRDPGAPRTVRALLDRVRSMRPGIRIELGHIELNAPLLDDTLAGLRGDVVLVPLLLGRGVHIGSDLPAALARAPHLSARVAEPLGPHPLLAEALHARLVEAGWRKAHRGGVVLAAAGSRDPASEQDAQRTADLLSDRLGGIPVLVGFASTGSRGIPEAIRTLAARGCHRVAMASYFTAPGRFAASCAAIAPGVVARPLGAHDAMARLVLHRYEQAVAAARDDHGLHAATA